MAEMWFGTPETAPYRTRNNNPDCGGLFSEKPKLPYFQVFTCRLRVTAAAATGTWQIIRKFVSFAKTKPNCAGNNSVNGIESILLRQHHQAPRGALGGEFVTSLTIRLKKRWITAVLEESAKPPQAPYPWHRGERDRLSASLRKSAPVPLKLVRA